MCEMSHDSNDLFIFSNRELFVTFVSFRYVRCEFTCYTTLSIEFKENRGNIRTVVVVISVQKNKSRATCGYLSQVVVMFFVLKINREKSFLISCKYDFFINKLNIGENRKFCFFYGLEHLSSNSIILTKY